MRKFFLATAVVLLSSSWVLAQNNSPSPTQTPDKSTPDKSKTAKSDKSGDTVEGCLSGAADTFTLTDAKGRTYQLTGDTSGLNKNIGHTVRLYGGASTSGPNPFSVWGSQATFAVKQVESLADTCKSWGKSK
jgi:hypothetical protein